jgi:hypothetical protein
VALCSIFDRYKSFGGTYCLHLQGRERWRFSTILQHLGYYSELHEVSCRKPVILFSKFYSRKQKDLQMTDIQGRKETKKEVF